MIEIQHTILQQIQVSLEFPVCFSENIFSLENTTLIDCFRRQEKEKQHKIIIFLDENVSNAFPFLKEDIANYCKKYSKHLNNVVSPVVVPGGENAKNDAMIVTKIQDYIEKFKICRHSFVVAIGGGAVLDMVGFACSTPHRGIRLIRIPTTVLSQNDSAMGVKNAINAYNKKNFLGTFASPYAVINDREFLRTLCFRDWISGVSEAIKVSLIKDASFFGFIHDNAEAIVARDLNIMEKIIFRCAELHLEHIRTSGDPFELGHSRPLDFGHWSAHKLESLSKYEIRHGEAVATGMAIDSFYAWKKNYIQEEECKKIIKTLQTLKFPLFYKEMDKKEFIDGLEEFREHLGGILCITLPNRIGNKIEVNEIEHKIILDAINYLREQQ